MTQFNPIIAEGLRDAAMMVRRGDMNGARRRAEGLITEKDTSGTVESFLGMICCQAGDLECGIRYFQTALAARPEDIALTINLAMATLEYGNKNDALVLCSAEHAARDPSQRLWRMRGFLLQDSEDFAGAVAAYEHVVGQAPDDFEIWNNLGNARVACGEISGAIEALQRATELRPDLALVRLNLATALLDATRVEEAEAILEGCVRDFPSDVKPFIEYAALLNVLDRPIEALDVLERASKITPNDPDIWVTLGEARVLARQTEKAYEAFERAVTLAPAHAQATIQLGYLYEHTNQVQNLRALRELAAERGVNSAIQYFLTAMISRRDQKFDAGLAALAHVPSDIEPIRVAQLTGEFFDRSGYPARAFASYSRVNELMLLDPTNPGPRSESYLDLIRHDKALVTPQWLNSWAPHAAFADEPAPVFLVGFPRSGTTLLDTMLMGHDRVQVMEEQPPLRVVERALGGTERLAALTTREVDDLRALFYSETRKCIDYDPRKTLIDKFPLHLNKVPLIHRLFPNAKFILTVRHPCDVVLSCFITSFALNNAMSNFLTLEKCAETYDLSFGYWMQCIQMMPVQVHTVYYERMIENVEIELRPLFAYLDLDWIADVTDHQKTALARGRIGTASYSQVTEPIYNRAVARWERYRDQLAPVMPMLSPWVTAHGYTRPD